MRVVGVVADTRDFGLDREPPAAVFHPLAQETTASALFLRVAGPVSAGLVEEAVRRIRALDPDQPVENVATFEQLRSESLAPQRLNLRLLGLFALTGLTIAAIGIAAVLAFTVSQRTRELGIRAALGADRGRLLRSVMAEGAGLAAAGILIGGLLALGLERAIGSLLHGVGSGDPITFAGTALVLLAVAVASALVPARRAAAADPAVALRSD